MKTYEATPHILEVPFVGVEIPPADTTKTATGSSTQYEERHTAATTSPSSSSASSQRPKITKQDIFTNGAAFILHNFLTKNECQSFIEQGENLGFVDCGYSKRIRKTERVAAASTEAAKIFFDRVRPFLEDSLDLTRKLNVLRYPEGVSRSIRPYHWYPIGLNPTFRICRYEQKGFFLPHHDGGFFQTEFCQSIQTFMVYLNDDFEGGETNFFTELQDHYKKPDPDNIVYSYRPKAGDALVFNSEITHDGGKLLSGRKYILRSEIMYHAPKEEEEELKRRGLQPDHDPDVEFSWP